MPENNVVTKEALKEILAEMRQEARQEIKEFRAETFARFDESEKKTAVRFDATDAKIEKLHSEFNNKMIQEQNEMLPAQANTIMAQNHEDDWWPQWVEDYNAVNAKQAEKRRKEAEALTERTNCLIERIEKNRQEYEELKARLGPFEYEKVSAAMAAVLEKARRSPFRRTQKKK